MLPNFELQVASKDPSLSWQHCCQITSQGRLRFEIGLHGRLDGWVLRFGLKPFSKITFFYFLSYGNLNKNRFCFLISCESFSHIVVALLLLFPLYRLYLYITHLLRNRRNFEQVDYSMACLYRRIVDLLFLFVYLM